MKTKRAFFALIFSASCFIGGCSSHDALEEGADTRRGTQQSNCSPELICTENFAVVSATVTYSDGTPVLLDSYKIVQTATGSDKTPTVSPAELDMYRKFGTYPITTDNYQKELVNQKVELEFIGYKNDKELTRRKFTVGADCCHVTLLAGDGKIIVEM